ncbi:hypothetical protein BO78DRAFT_413783 [Aspergillus sclerotiicarbonarius CBS 121057]|uniref:Uncharacterized protein n=1 Tax=Aspergillus sclerotiicarbonarius (strain CBS 121057 / IBT 28362) TaxID=1448318 RepID=A0A319ETG5_ASPSB|nr:hypothetical protein BO78DRAFT_413783 [Aspergillus sclerotiicarbonarius CBS 121057]
MYPLSQEPPDSTTLARLSLAKFSHTTTSLNHRGPLHWSHVMGNGDLIGVLERRAMTSFTPDRILLKVLGVHGNLVIPTGSEKQSETGANQTCHQEEIDLTHFAIEAGNMTQSSQTTASKPIFAVVVKLPCLAVKYPRANMIHRFQIKFSFDRDFYTALAILSDMKCPFSEASVGSMRKLTSSQWNSGSIESASMTREPTYGLSMPGPSASHPVTFCQQPPATSASGSSSSVTAGTSLPTTSSSTAQTSHTYFTRLSKSRNSTTQGQVPPNFAQPIIQEDFRTPDDNHPRPSTSTSSMLAKHTQQLDIPPKRDLPFASATKSTSTKKKDPPIFSQITNAPTKANRAATGSTKTTQASTNPPKTATPKPRPATSSGTITILRYSKPNSNSEKQPLHPEPNIPPSTGTYNPPDPATNIQSLNPSYFSSSHLQTELDKANKVTTTSGESQQGKLQDDFTAVDLSAYMSAPTAERMASIEAWICSQLEDDGFVQLCQDMEGIWQRIAFGR